MSGPERIWIVGPCGSGKSVVADRLAAELGLPATHLDELYWKPGWVESPREEFAARVGEIANRERWVIDGNYGQVRPRWAHRAELFVWLDLPLRVTLPRLLARCLRRWARHEACCNGNYETLRRTFAHRDSILWWAITTDKRRRVELTAEFETLPHVRLRSQAEIDAWLADRPVREIATPGSDSKP